mgnify:FL=1
MAGTGRIAASPIIKAVHWALATACAIAFLTGCAAFDFDAQPPHWASRDALFAAHRIAGIAAGLLAITWAALRIPATLRPLMPDRGNALIRTAHIGIAALVLAASASAWIARASGGRLAELYSLFPTYNLVSQSDSPAAYTLFALHKSLVGILLAAVAIHILAALFHEFVLRDGALRKMFGSTNEKRSHGDGNTTIAAKRGARDDAINVRPGS